MKKLFVLLLLTFNAQAQNLAICQGEYALCAASPATPTGNSIVVGNKVFKEGMAVCPVLDGSSIANLDLMGGSCTAAKGKVWSLFGFPPLSSFPQAPTCLLYTSPSPRDRQKSRMPSSA